MENIKDYILKTEVEEINAAVPAPAPKAKPKVSYETVFASGPDFAVRRKTPKTSMVMVIIVSKGQFYIKDESCMRILCRSLSPACPTADMLSGMPTGTRRTGSQRFRGIPAGGTCFCRR